MLYREWNRYKVLQVFFNDPDKKWHLREIERKIGLSHPAIKDHMKVLEKDGLVDSTEEGVFKGYKASKSEMYRRYKLNDLLIRIRTSGLVKKIEETCTPNCIVLFGSSVEGKDDKKGDIDIFVESEERDIDLSVYEKKLERYISLIFESDLTKVNDELKNSIANGIVLSGYLKMI